MSWGKSAQPKPSASTLSKLLPLVIILVILVGACWVGYQIFLSINKMSESATQQMGKSNVVFTKDGVKVGVKQIENESYVDATQSFVVKAWNLGSGQDGPKDVKKRK